jgi:cytochrome c oxidase subunit 2
MKLQWKGLLISAAAAVLALASIVGYVVAHAAEADAKVIKISAKRFDYTPGHLILKKGVPVILELSTRDVLMGFNLPDFNLRADIIPDKVVRVRFVPDKTGTFTFLCDIFCGTGHEQMQGSITVVA